MVVAAGLILPGAVSPSWLCLYLPAPGYSRRGNCPSLPGVGKGLDWTLSPSLAGAELRRMDRSVQAGERRSGSPVIPGKVTWTCPPHAETTPGKGRCESILLMLLRGPSLPPRPSPFPRAAHASPGGGIPASCPQTMAACRTGFSVTGVPMASPAGSPAVPSPAGTSVTAGRETPGRRGKLCLLRPHVPPSWHLALHLPCSGS